MCILDLREYALPWDNTGNFMAVNLHLRSNASNACHNIGCWLKLCTELKGGKPETEALNQIASH